MKVVVTRTHKKVVTLRLDDDGVLQVVANNKLSLSHVKQIVEGHRDWINEQIKIGLCRKASGSACHTKATCAALAMESDAEPRRHVNRVPKNENANTHAVKDVSDDVNRDFTSTQNAYYGEMFSGKKCLLCGRVHKVMPTAESKCHLDGNCIYVPQKYYSDKESRLKALKGYLKKLSAQHVSDQISKFGSQTSLCPTKIEFRNLQVGWTKCTTPVDRVITLDYRICQLPPDLQQYLIVHAFSHFSNATHDDDFWNTVSNHLPHYKNCLNELSQYEFLKDI